MIGKVIHWKLCKKFQVNHITKYHMYKPESILGNDANKILWDFEMKQIF